MKAACPRVELCLAFVLVCFAPISFSQCTSGWTYVADDGIEGQDSCIRLFSLQVNFGGAQNYCEGLGGHLLTITGSSKTSPLFVAAGALNPTGSPFIGCYQNSDSTRRGTGWRWVDSTDAGNLNCGTGMGEQGCGLWRSNEPK
jgi:hypothetical protein